MLLALLGCSFFILAVIVIFLSDPFPLGQISVDLSVVSESSEILRNNSLVSVCLSVPKCWEYKNVGSLKMLRVHKCWELKNVGSTKMLEAQKCLEDKIVGCAKMLGVQICLENKSVGRSKLLGVQTCWESYPIVTFPFS